MDSLTRNAWWNLFRNLRSPSPFQIMATPLWSTAAKPQQRLYSVFVPSQDKQKADELSALAAKRQQALGGKKKRGCTPNTTRGSNRFEVADGLHDHNAKNNKEVRQKEK